MGVTQFMWDQEPDRAMREFDSHNRICTSSSMHCCLVALPPGPIRPCQYRRSEKCLQRLVIEFPWCPVYVIEARPVIRPINENETDTVPAHRAGATRARRFREWNAGRKTGFDTVAVPDEDPFARHQEFRRFLGEHTRGSLDEPAIGDQRKRIVGERSQIRPGRHRIQPATNSASPPGVIAPTCTPSRVKRRAISRS